MLSFYEKQGFKLFPCNLDKTPQVNSWRSTAAHIGLDEAERIADTGGYIGAWLPKSYVVIDVDMGHKSKDGKEKPEGLPIFLDLVNGLGIEGNIMESTLVIKTGSGGFHLYFTVDEELYPTLSQKSIAESVDVRTHAGYVIAAGTHGYTIHHKKLPAPLPQQLLDIITRRNTETAKVYNPDRILPPDVLKKVLNKLDPKDFATNTDWQELITACIAAAGNDVEVIDILEKWSKADPNYENDPSVRKRIETFEPSGGITAGTFIYILRQHDISKYLIDKIRTYIGAEFTLNERFGESFQLPFDVDFSLIHEHKALMEAFYYARNQAAAVALIARITAGNLLHVEDERRFYYFSQSRWIEAYGVLNVIFAVLLHAGQRFYTDVSAKKDKDAVEYYNSYVGYIGSISTLQRIEVALKQHPEVTRKSVLWDSPALESTLTLRDSVMDFSQRGKIVFRQGKRDEYRRLFIDLSETDFKEEAQPVKFKEFLKDVFPDSETRKTATYALSIMLSGTGKFRKFQIWNGSGSNGKSALMDIMTQVIGKERAVPYGADILLSSKPTTSLTPELAALRGALVAFASETEESKRVSQGMIKHLTGDEEMTANPKYQGMITFKTTFQLVLSTNYLPSFSAHDNAFVDRLLILPFYTCFYDSEEKKEAGKRGGSRYFAPAKDINILKKEILEERAHILAYLARRYQELDISIPESEECTQAKAHYVKDNNGIVDLIYEMIEYDETGVKNWFTPTADLVNFYNEDQNTRYSSKFIIMRIKEVLPGVENSTRRVHSKLTRGLKNIRLKYGAYPEGGYDNFTEEEIKAFSVSKQEF